MSVTIRVLVRASKMTSPRGERNFLTIGAISAARAYESRYIRVFSGRSRRCSSAELPLRGVFRGQGGHGRDAEDPRSSSSPSPQVFSARSKAVVQRHFLQLQGQLAGDAGMGDDLEVAELGHQADDVEDVGVLEVHGDPRLLGRRAAGRRARPAAAARSKGSENRHDA